MQGRLSKPSDRLNNKPQNILPGGFRLHKRFPTPYRRENFNRSRAIRSFFI